MAPPTCLDCGRPAPSPWPESPEAMQWGVIPRCPDCLSALRDAPPVLPPRAPDADWADGYIRRLDRDTRKLTELIGREGLIVGGMTDEEALDYMSRAESRAAELRAELQERVKGDG